MTCPRTPGDMPMPLLVDRVRLLGLQNGTISMVCGLCGTNAERNIHNRGLLAALSHIFLHQSQETSIVQGVHVLSLSSPVVKRCEAFKVTAAWISSCLQQHRVNHIIASLCRKVQWSKPVFVLSVYVRPSIEQRSDSVNVTAQGRMHQWSKPFVVLVLHVRTNSVEDDSKWTPRLLVRTGLDLSPHVQWATLHRRLQQFLVAQRLIIMLVLVSTNAPYRIPRNQRKCA
mmetsp:Transcript_8440/g.15892  ORF Transcript_8440/g.15892 Transcript_8440/m.15892 type:complete len:228 (-) Transcript_8440:140-823(-)